LAPVPCDVDTDCRWDRLNAAQCTCGDATCGYNNECTQNGAAYIDLIRADFLYKDAQTFIANVVLYSLNYFGVSTPAIADDQKEEYVGTMWLQAPVLAAGTYVLDMARGTNFTGAIDNWGVDFPPPNVETLQIEIFNPCADFDLDSCPDPSSVCRVNKCEPVEGSPTCVEVQRNCEEEEEFGPGYDCVVNEIPDGCVPFRACCHGTDYAACRVRSETWCTAQDGIWRDLELECGPPNPCINCEGSMYWNSSDPPSGVLDARQARDVADGLTLQGIDTIVVPGDTGLAPVCFELCETETEGAANDLTVAESPEGTYTITLDRRITPGGVTTIMFAEGTDTESVGTYSSLPADTNADELSDVDDIIELVECCLNQNCVPVHGEYSCDIDHSGSNTGADVLRVLDVLNGSGDFVKAWDGVQLNTANCP
jgi:hypothetical protein